MREIFGCKGFLCLGKNHNDYLIEWESYDDIKIYNVDGTYVDGYEEEFENKMIFWDYDGISYEIFRILKSKINGSKVEEIRPRKERLSNISTFIFSDNDMLIELIIDEANYRYYIHKFLGKSSFINPPLKVLNMLIDGLSEAGYKKINIEKV